MSLTPKLNAGPGAARLVAARMDALFAVDAPEGAAGCVPEPVEAVPGPLRVIVTGSRSWEDPAAVRRALDAVAAEHPGRPLVVRHGACRTGADAHASRWCRRQVAAGMPVVEEARPAQWTRYGNAAGPIRNAAMVAEGAELVLAFPKPGSRGTWDCVAKAEAVGIPVVFPAGRGGR